MTRLELMTKYRQDRLKLLKHLELVHQSLIALNYLSETNTVELATMKLAYSEFKQTILHMDNALKSELTSD